MYLYIQIHNDFLGVRRTRTLNTSNVSILDYLPVQIKYRRVETLNPFSIIICVAKAEKLDLWLVCIQYKHH